MTVNQMEIIFLGGHHPFLGQQMTVTATAWPCGSMAGMPGPEPWLARCCAMVINAVLDQEGSESSKPFHIYLSLLFLRVLGFS